MTRPTDDRPVRRGAGEPASPIRAIAFDWGGVFTEGTFDSSAVRNLAALAHVPEDEIAATYFPLMERFEAGAFDFDTFHRLFVDRSGLDLDPGPFRKTFLGSVRERAAMFRILDGIPRGITVGMLSNNVPVLCDRVRDDARMARVEHFVFSNEIGVRKPDAAAYRALSSALGVPAAATAFVDDNPTNIACANELGFTGILLDSFPAFLERWRTHFPHLAVDLQTP